MSMSMSMAMALSVSMSMFMSVYVYVSLSMPKYVYIYEHRYLHLSLDFHLYSTVVIHEGPCSSIWGSEPQIGSAFILHYIVLQASALEERLGSGPTVDRGPLGRPPSTQRSTERATQRPEGAQASWAREAGQRLSESPKGPHKHKDPTKQYFWDSALTGPWNQHVSHYVYVVFSAPVSEGGFCGGLLAQLWDSHLSGACMCIYI